MGFESIAPLRTFGCVMRMSTTEESSLQRKETVNLSKSNLTTVCMRCLLLYVSLSTIIQLGFFTNTSRQIFWLNQILLIHIISNATRSFWIACYSGKVENRFSVTRVCTIWMRSTGAARQFNCNAPSKAIPNQFQSILRCSLTRINFVVDWKTSVVYITENSPIITG
jgi:hypothetical protein